ncbi:MAG: quinolinate synthase NadA [Micavibrio sp.]|nr:quinolinate synthase NadA [Micavibrio sp.]
MDELVSTDNTFAQLLDPKDPEVCQATDHFFEKAKLADPLLTREQWEADRAGPYICAIEQLKAEKNAAVIGHNYMHPYVSFVCDYLGDSLKMGEAAASEKFNDKSIIVNAGVKFMAETAKTLNPQKKVLQPSMDAGCSLAASIVPADVDLMRVTHPGIPIVNYANTYVDVRAKSDALCTSSNIVDIAVEITKEWNIDKVILAPDQYLARNTQITLDGMYERGDLDRRIEVITHPGSCEVHERYDPEEIKILRITHPDIVILAHPECIPAVIEAADFSGSTAQMADYVATHRPKILAMITECAQGYQIAMAYPEAQIVSSSCKGCPHMRQINMRNVYEALVHEQHEIIIPDDILVSASVPLQKMKTLMERASQRKASQTEAEVA